MLCSMRFLFFTQVQGWESMPSSLFRSSSNNQGTFSSPLSFFFFFLSSPQASFSAMQIQFLLPDLLILLSLPPSPSPPLSFLFFSPRPNFAFLPSRKISVLCSCSNLQVEMIQFGNTEEEEWKQEKREGGRGSSSSNFFPSIFFCKIVCY